MHPLAYLHFAHVYSLLMITVAGSESFLLKLPSATMLVHATRRLLRQLLAPLPDPTFEHAGVGQHNSAVWDEALGPGLVTLAECESIEAAYLQVLPWHLHVPPEPSRLAGPYLAGIHIENRDVVQQVCTATGRNMVFTMQEMSVPDAA